MSDEESWIDSAVDWAEDTAASVSETLSEGAEKLGAAATHSLRSIEDGIDTDDDGSLLDEVMGGAIQKVPYVGGTIGAVGEEVGDFLTDALGTRHTGVFSQEGTYEQDTKDTDYQPDSQFQQQGGGFGQWLNETTGINDHVSPETIVDLGLGGTPYLAVGGGDEMRDNVDVYASPDQTDENGHVDYDQGAAE